MELALPDRFPTRVWVEEELDGELLPAGHWTLIGDEAVRGSWRERGLPEPPGTLWVPTSEAGKRLESVIPWLEAWAGLPLLRSSTVVAVGGGVLTDMAGLGAALYMRGIRWHAWPTTLLSQVDAGLGGKTGVDLAGGKNLAGAFHHPEWMVVCRAFLRTLPARHLSAGRWEIFKMALIQGDQDWAETLLEEGLPDSGALLRALLGKAGVVSRDPLEQGERRLLNLGHTLGHALEAASGYRLMHGEAVGLGTLAACCLTATQGLPPFPEAFLERVAGRLRHLAPLVPAWADCLPWLARDKKSAKEASASGATAIHCIVPCHRSPAVQKLLLPEAWDPAHRRMSDLLH